MTGSSVFDFDGDGRAEVAYADEQHFRIFDGATGLVLFETPNSSVTGIEYPVIADVDNDNRAEIVIVANNWYGPSLIDGKGFHGVRVFEDANDNWVNTRKIWNQHTYHITNINEDGSIPRVEENNWEIYNNYRCNSLLPDEINQVSDITVSYITEDQANYPDSVTLTARIGNGGAVYHPAGVEVTFYDGDPEQDGVLIGSAVTQGVINKGDFEDLSIVWSYPSEGLHDIYVIADEINTFNECSEDNNIASATISVGVTEPPTDVDLPDLEVSPDDVTIIPPDPFEGQTARIAAIIHNIGTLDANSVIIAFYDGSPLSGGALIGTVSSALVSAGNNVLAEVPWDTFGQSGRNYIHIVVDPQDVIEEFNENNNTTIKAVDVQPPVLPDLAVTASDLSFSNMNPQEGESLILNATVHNFGVDVGNIEVSLYDGDPATGGMLIDGQTILQIIPFGSGMELEFDIDTIDKTGEHNFYLVADPVNAIEEINEANNTAWKPLTIAGAGINISVSTDKPEYTAREDVQMTVDIESLMSSGRTGTLRVEIADLTGNAVETVAPDYSIDLSPLGTITVPLLWNTGATYAGSYMVKATYYENGYAIARADTQITIVPVRDVASAIVTDKMSYGAHETVTIASTIQSASPNYILKGLDARITLRNPQGLSVYTEMTEIPLLVPGQGKELNSYWNTATGMPGGYTVTLEVLDGNDIVSTSTATFEIVGSSFTGSGIAGSIQVEIDPVYQGQTQTYKYAIDYTGNEDITDAEVIIRVVDPETGELKLTVSGPADLPVNTSIAGSFTSLTSTLSPKNYLAVLQISTPVMTVPKTLDRAVFEVLPGIEVSYDDPRLSNLLVWINNGCKESGRQSAVSEQDIERSGGHSGDDEHDHDGDEGDGDGGHGTYCGKGGTLEALIADLTRSYTIVYDKKDFQTEMRNPFYTDILILGDHHSVEDHYADELIEKVYSGMGIISSKLHFHGYGEGDDGHHEKYDPVFGIKHRGHLDDREYHTVETRESPITPVGEIIEITGTSEKVEAAERTTVAGIIRKAADSFQRSSNSRDEDDDDHHGKGDEYPGIVLNEYGEGRAVYHAFDIEETLNEANYDRIRELLRDSLGHVHNTDTDKIYPYEFIGHRIELANMAEETVTLRLDIARSPELALYDPVTGIWREDNPWQIELDVPALETASVLYYLLTPDTAGTYTVDIDILFKDGTEYTLFETVHKDITVDNTIEGLIEAVLAALPSIQDREDAGEIQEHLEAVRARYTGSQREVGRAVHECLGAIAHARKGQYEDIRVKLDDLLLSLEGLWFFNPD